MLTEFNSLSGTNRLFGTAELGAKRAFCAHEHRSLPQTGHGNGRSCEEEAKTDDRL